LFTYCVCHHFFFEWLVALQLKDEGKSKERLFL
jgi:hypothetical protein